VKDKRTFEDITKDNPIAAKSILSNLREYLLAVLNKPDILSYSIVHKPFLIYLTKTNDAGKFEMIESLRDHLAHMIHTNNGAKVGSLCIAYGKPKDRKVITKTFQGYASRIAKEEFGHIVILQIINSVDDTKLVYQSLIKELLKDGLDLCRDKYARLCFLSILVGFVSKYFSPSTLDLLKPVTVTDPQNDKQQVPTSKKNPEVRRKELLDSILPPLTKVCEDHSHELATDVTGHDILIETYRAADESNRAKLRTALLSWVNFDPSQVPSEKEKMERKYHPMEEKPTIKHDIANDLYAHKVLRAWINTDNEFSTQLLNKMKSNITEYATLNKASSVLIELLKKQETASEVQQLLKPQIKELSNVSHNSTKKLVEMLNA